MRYPNVEDRFLENVHITNDCWLWLGHKLWNGYGAIRSGTRRIKVHRFSWELHKGEIPKSKLVLHKCDNPACVNPEHLYLGSQKDNAVDRDSRGRNGYSKRTHCKRGHALIPDNIYLYRNKRTCRACRRITRCP